MVLQDLVALVAKTKVSCICMCIILITILFAAGGIVMLALERQKSGRASFY